MNVEATWSILSKVIKTDKKQTNDCEYMNKNNRKVYDNQESANMFNDFYINVGPKIASKIDTNHVQLQYDTYLKDLNVEKSMFAHPCTEEEVTQMIYNFTNKTSQDVNGISMKLIKELKDHLIKPLSHICNRSFQTKLKQLKYYPYMNQVINTMSATITQCLYCHNFLKCLKNYLKSD